MGYFQLYKRKSVEKASRLEGKKLSKFGKKDLIKLVARAIPSYCTSTFLLPSNFTLVDLQ